MYFNSVDLLIPAPFDWNQNKNPQSVCLLMGIKN